MASHDHGRLTYIDALRGAAIIYMIGFEMFNFFSKTNTYTDPPYFIPQINSLTLLGPPILFCFVSGISVYLLTKKLQTTDMRPLQIAANVIGRYIRYIPISLALTWLMWDLDTFFRWNEAIQGIATAAIATSILIIIFSDRLAAFVILIPTLSFARHYLLTNHWMDPTYTFWGLIANVTYMGWFSLMNLIPMFLGGIIAHRLLTDGGVRQVIIFGLAKLASATILHTSFGPIDYYRRSVAFSFYAIGAATCILLFIYWLVEGKGRFRWLRVWGRASLLVYVGNYAILGKGLEIFGLAYTMSDSYSWVLTIVIMSGVNMLLLAREKVSAPRGIWG